MTASIGELLSGAQRTAYHLEQRDVWTMHTEEHRRSFEAFTATGEADDDPDGENWREWTGIVRAAARRGVEFRRLRIISEPVTDYIRWEHAITGANIAAGEQVRWLPRPECVDLLVVPVDFWVLDSASVRFGHFSGEGDIVSHELRTDPQIVKMVAECFEAAWDRGIPHERYNPA